MGWIRQTNGNHSRIGQILGNPSRREDCKNRCNQENHRLCEGAQSSTSRQQESNLVEGKIRKSISKSVVTYSRPSNRGHSRLNLFQLTKVPQTSLPKNRCIHKE